MVNVTIKNLSGSEVEIEGELPAEQFETYRKHAIEHLKSEIKIDGFRQGKIPESMILERLGEGAILEEMAGDALSDLYSEIIRENKIDAIGRPEITVTKLASNNPFGFKMKTAVMPSFELPDYKLLAKEAQKDPEAITVTDEEVAEVLEELRKHRKKSETDPAPALDDAFAASMGNFKTLDELKSRIRENLTLEKTERAKQKKRIAILESLTTAMKVELPTILMTRETEALIAEQRHNIEDMGLDYQEYLTRIKKTEDDLRKEALPAAERRIKTKMILKKIAAAEKITVEEEEITREVDRLVDYYKGGVDRDRATMYAEDVLRDEKVFQLLESQQ